MKKVIENINGVLAEWNPIGVPEDIATDEYKAYIPLIIQALERRQQLMNCLEDILVNKIGVEYDPSNITHVEDLQQVRDRIIQVYQNANPLY